MSLTHLRELTPVGMWKYRIKMGNQRGFYQYESLYCKTNLESWKVKWNPYAFGLWYFHLWNLFWFRMWLRLWRRNAKLKLLFIMNIRRNSRWEQVRQVSDSRIFLVEGMSGLKIWTVYSLSWYLHCKFYSVPNCCSVYLFFLFVCLETETEGRARQGRRAQVCQWRVGRIWLLMQLL